VFTDLLAEFGVDLLAEFFPRSLVPTRDYAFVENPKDRLMIGR
jgi:hypothetical protein